MPSVPGPPSLLSSPSEQASRGPMTCVHRRVRVFGRGGECERAVLARYYGTASLSGHIFDDEMTRPEARRERHTQTQSDGGCGARGIHRWTKHRQAQCRERYSPWRTRFPGARHCSGLRHARAQTHGQAVTAQFRTRRWANPRKREGSRRRVSILSLYVLVSGRKSAHVLANLLITPPLLNS